MEELKGVHLWSRHQAGVVGQHSIRGGHDSSEISILIGCAVNPFGTHLAREMIKPALQMKVW